MKHLLLLALFLLFLSANHGQKPILWKKLRTEDQVRQAFKKKLPKGASAKVITAILQLERHDFLQCYGDTMIAFISPNEPAALLVHRKWMMRFHFSADTLCSLTIGEALTGP
jgi:hypothetical protein